MRIFTFFSFILTIIAATKKSDYLRGLRPPISDKLFDGVDSKINYVKYLNKFDDKWADLKHKFCSYYKKFEENLSKSKIYKQKYKKYADEFSKLESTYNKYLNLCKSDQTATEKVQNHIEITKIPSYINQVDAIVVDIERVEQIDKLELENAQKIVDDEKVMIAELLELIKKVENAQQSKLSCLEPKSFYKHKSSKNFVILVSGYSKSEIERNCMSHAPNARFIERLEYNKFTDKNDDFEVYLSDIETIYKVEKSKNCLYVGDFERLSSNDKKLCDEENLMFGICRLELPAFC